MNLSQINDPRFRAVWRNAGAIRSIATNVVAEPRILRTIPTEYANEGAQIVAILMEILNEAGYKLDFTMRRTWGLHVSGIGPATVTFGVRGRKFKFWHDLSPRFDVIPASHLRHPSREKPNDAFLLNGSTDVICWGEHITHGERAGINHVLSPFASRTTKDWLGRTWSHLHNPFIAEGRTFEIELDPRSCTETTWRCLKAFLLAALGHEDKHVFVSGGFNPPYNSYPADMFPASITARCSPLPRIWQYLMLARDGKLRGASIPDWLFTENLFGRAAGLVREHTPELAPFLPV